MAGNYGQYGEPGSAIAGSNFVRAYCQICDEPMRVHPIQLARRGEDDLKCAECDEHEPRPVDRAARQIIGMENIQASDEEWTDCE